MWVSLLIFLMILALFLIHYIPLHIKIEISKSHMQLWRIVSFYYTYSVVFGYETK